MSSLYLYTFDGGLKLGRFSFNPDEGYFFCDDFSAHNISLGDKLIVHDSKAGNWALIEVVRIENNMVYVEVEKNYSNKPLVDAAPVIPWIRFWANLFKVGKHEKLSYFVGALAFVLPISFASFCFLFLQHWFLLH